MHTENIGSQHTDIDIASEFLTGVDSSTITVEVDANTAEIYFRHIEGPVGEARMNFSPEGIYVAAMNAKRTSGTRMLIPAEECSGYPNGEFGCVGYDTSALGTALRNLKTRKTRDDTLTFTVETADIDGGTLTVTDSRGFSESIPVIDPTAVRESPDVWQTDLDLSVGVTFDDTNLLREFIKGLPRKGTVALTAAKNDSEGVTEFAIEHMTENDDEEFVPRRTLLIEEVDAEWVSDGSRNPSRTAVSDDVDDLLEWSDTAVRSFYTAKFLKDFATRLRKTRTVDVPYTLRFGEEWPLSLTRDDGLDHYAEFILAPRIMT